MVIFSLYVVLRFLKVVTTPSFLLLKVSNERFIRGSLDFFFVFFKSYQRCLSFSLLPADEDNRFSYTVH